MLVLYDGSFVYLDMNVMWVFVEKVKINYFGMSVFFLVVSMKCGINFFKDFDFSVL